MPKIFKNWPEVFKKAKKKHFWFFFQFLLYLESCLWPRRVHFWQPSPKSFNRRRKFLCSMSKNHKKRYFSQQKIDSSQSVSMDTQIAILTIFLKTKLTDGRHFFALLSKILKKEPSSKSVIFVELFPRTCRHRYLETCAKNINKKPNTLSPIVWNDKNIFCKSF